MCSCYGNFNDFDDYCWYNCPYSYECEYKTYAYYDPYFDDYYWY